MDIDQFRDNPKTVYLFKEYDRLSKEIQNATELAETDPELKELTDAEIKNLKASRDVIEENIKSIIESEKAEEASPSEVILEVRAGAGGDEAAFFAATLANMYEKYSALKGWSFSRVDESQTELGGYKEASFEIKGKDVYNILKNEMGVHRVQRVPATEKQGRVHTSTASVAVLPIVKTEGIEIKESDLEIEFSRSGGAGGQNVNKVETAVRIIHKPSGLAVRCTSERSQLKNREKAMSILASKLMEMKREEEAKKLGTERKNQIGSGDRSEKIRTYNILQDRITDHRIKKSWHNIEKILAGGFDPIVQALQEAEKNPDMQNQSDGEDLED